MDGLFPTGLSSVKKNVIFFVGCSSTVHPTKMSRFICLLQGKRPSCQIWKIYILLWSLHAFPPFNQPIHPIGQSFRKTLHQSNQLVQLNTNYVAGSGFCSSDEGVVGWLVAPAPDIGWNMFYTFHRPSCFIYEPRLYNWIIWTRQSSNCSGFGAKC